MRIWTKEQYDAITAKNHELLISAAAGSGKTAVLVERILNRVEKDGVDINHMLVVTFTKAAAAEMRERLQKELLSRSKTNDSLRRQLSLLDSAQISTLHVFCGKIIREYFQEAEIDPTARVCDDAQGKVLFEKALDEALDEAYNAADDNFQYLSACYEEKNIRMMLSSLYRFLMAQASPWEWLQAQTGICFDYSCMENLPAAHILIEEMRIMVEGILSLSEDLLHFCDRENAYPPFRTIAEEDHALVQALDTALNGTYQDIKDSMDSLTFVRMPSVKKGEIYDEIWGNAFKQKRNDLKGAVKELTDMLPNDEKQSIDDLKALQPGIRSLGKLVHLLNEKYTQIKDKKNVVDFSDLEHKALQVLSVPRLREEISGRFDSIFVDECQDISGIQEAILQSVHGDSNDIFFVGDVKQSIYRFRLADPTLFLHKYRTFSPDENAMQRKIILQQNFRSCKSVLYATNHVFESVMHEKVTEMDYDKDAKLFPRDDAPFGPPAELLLLKKSSEKEDTESDQEALMDAEREALVIGHRINQLLNQQPEAGKNRLAFKDIAILMPVASGISSKVAKILSTLGIPSYSDADDQYFSQPEIAAMMALFRIIDNPMQDVPFLAVTRLPCFALSEETLSRVRLLFGQNGESFYQAFQAFAASDDEEHQKAASLLKTLSRWRFLSNSLSLSALVWLLCQESGVYSACGSLKGGETRQANLLLLCRKAEDYEQLQQGSLAGFITYADLLTVAEDKTTAHILSEEENVVRLMTIHKSKGLEFPVVFVMGLGSQLKRQHKESALMMHTQLGLSLPYVDPKNRITRKTIQQQGIALLQKKEQLAEKARVLYVAMTRAKEKLILVGTFKSKSQVNTWGLEPGCYRVSCATSMLDWVCQAVSDLPEAQVLRDLSTDFDEPQKLFSEIDNFSTDFPQSDICWNCKVFDASFPPPVETIIDLHSLIAQSVMPCGNPVDNSIFVVPATPEPLPLKTSVSSLVRQQAENREEEDETTKSLPLSAPAPFTISDIRPMPDFLSEGSHGMSAAQRGTLTHKVLGLLDYHFFAHGVTCEALNSAIDVLLSRQILSPDESEALHRKWLTSFLSSPLGYRARASETVHREWAFNLVLSENAPMLVQGIIDLCFLEKGQWVLVDYKTDYVEDVPSISERYRPQLALYQQALSRITKIPVKETHLFLLRTGEDILL